MSSDSAAQRYAIALYEMARDAKLDAVIYRNAQDFMQMLDSATDLKTALSHPNIKRADRKKILDAVLQDAQYETIFANFLRVLADKGKILLYHRIVAEYEVLRDHADGRVRASVYVANPMNPDQKQQLKSKIESQLHHEVALKEIIEPSIIAGFRLEIQGRVYDNSIRRHLERLRSDMHIG